MSSGRKYSFSDALFSSTFIHNPVLIQAAGLCAIVAVATTLKTAVSARGGVLPGAYYNSGIRLPRAQKSPEMDKSRDISAHRHGDNCRNHIRN